MPRNDKPVIFAPLSIRHGKICEKHLHENVYKIVRDFREIFSAVSEIQFGQTFFQVVLLYFFKLFEQPVSIRHFFQTIFIAENESVEKRTAIYFILKNSFYLFSEFFTEFFLINLVCAFQKILHGVFIQCVYVCISVVKIRR